MPWPKTSRHARGYGSAWDQIRLRILARDKHLCQPCRRKGRLTAATEVNHVKPKAQGGTDDVSNLESTCSPCHRAETLRQSAAAQGRAYRPKQRIDVTGWPVQE